MTVQIEQDQELLTIYSNINIHFFLACRLPEKVGVKAQRLRNAITAFRPNELEDKESGKRYHSLVIHSDLLHNRDEFYTQFLHLMVHLWHWEYGTKGKARREYHGKEFTDKMRELGVDVVTKDGYRIEDQIIIPGGQFSLFLNAFGDRLMPTITPATFIGAQSDGDRVSTRQKFICDRCKTEAKIELSRSITISVRCQSCDRPMLSEDEYKRQRDKELATYKARVYKKN